MPVQEVGKVQFECQNNAITMNRHVHLAYLFFSGVARPKIGGGVHIHIFVLCLTDFFGTCDCFYGM